MFIFNNRKMKEDIFDTKSNQPPSGTPSLTVIKAGISMPISIATVSTAMVGIVATIAILIMVIKYRHHPVFKHSRY